MPQLVRRRAPAKVNLSLDVHGKRADGYHDLTSVMQAVSLYDTLTVQRSSRLTFSCSEPSLVDDNLVVRAAQLLAAHFGMPPRARIHLEKSIPVGAGLGGGSSDAAAALLALSQLWDLNPDCETLLRLAATIGSDVPFFLFGGTAQVRGRGEHVSPIRTAVQPWYVLINPGIHVSTAHVFAAFSVAAAHASVSSRDVTAALTAGRTLAGGNDLEVALVRAYPDASHALEQVRARLPDAHLSGSGPTMFVVRATESEAMAARTLMSDLGWWTTIARAETVPDPGSPCTAAAPPGTRHRS